MAWRNSKPFAPPRRLPFGVLSVALAMASLLVWDGSAHAGSPQVLTTKIIHATKGAATIDPRLKDLAKELKPLEFTSYVLTDEADLTIELGSVGRMQLPGGEWMNVRAIGEVPGKGLLRVSIAVDKLEFKATVGIAEGATVVLRGPPFRDGTLVLALTRKRPDPASH